MSLSKSIDFLLENAGAVIQYRLRKEIMKNLTQTEEDNLLEQIYQTPNFKLVESYAKPNGYIGIGMHTGSAKLHETPLHDGETAARLLSYYAVPKTHPLVKNLVVAMRNEETLRQEFSYSSSAVKFFNNIFVGMNSGFCLEILLSAIQAMLGYGDDPELDEIRRISFEAFKHFMCIGSLSEITKTRKSSAKYNYPYIDEDTYCPSVNHLASSTASDTWSQILSGCPSVTDSDVKR